MSAPLYAGRDVSVFIEGRGWISGWRILWASPDWSWYSCQNPNRNEAAATRIFKSKHVCYTPVPYASYPTTGDMSPRQQHDADEALITEGKVWAASGMPSLGLQRNIEINGALCRHIDWLKAQLASLRGEE